MIFIDFIIRLLSAVFLGFIIGLERQYRQTLAGIRTNVLVCIGSCLFVMYASIISSTDSARIAAQVVTGVGFLGGGVILREGFNVRGLNTAATLWCTASVGALCSTGNILFAGTASIIIVFSNIILRPVAKKLFASKSSRADKDEYIYLITIKCLEDIEFNVRSSLMQLVGAEKLVLRNLESSETENDAKVRIKAELISIEKSDMILERIVGILSLEVGVTSIGWKVLGD